jgi:hypothetical protein
MIEFRQSERTLWKLNDEESAASAASVVLTIASSLNQELLPLYNSNIVLSFGGSQKENDIFVKAIICFVCLKDQDDDSKFDKKNLLCTTTTSTSTPVVWSSSSASQFLAIPLFLTLDLLIVLKGRIWKAIFYFSTLFLQRNIVFGLF